jgi:hypothetical protein
MPELTVWVTMVRGTPHVAKAVQLISEQGGKAGVVQPILTEPSIGSEGGVGVVIHLSKTREKRINISSIEQRQQTKTPNKPPRQNSNPDSDLDWQQSRKTLLTEYDAESGNMHNTKVISNFKAFPESINTLSYDQQFKSYDHCKLGVCWKFPLSGQISYPDKFEI